jgi:NADPH2:quinone reductase
MMKAVLMHQPGSPEVLQYSEVEPPQLKNKHEILVRVHAAGVNPIDTKLRSRGTYYPELMPAILGCDGAGVVEAVGDAVHHIKPGDEVFYCHGGIGGEPGSYADYKVINARFVAKKPADIDFATAAAAPLALITAWESLYDRARIQPGWKVLIHAGAGGVGHLAIQLAKAAGCEVITTVSSMEKAKFVEALGADRTILYKEQDFAEAATAWSGGGVDMVFDTIGGKIFEQSFHAVRPYGHIVTLLQPGEVNWTEARLRNLSTSLELMLSPMYYGWHEAERHQARILEQCAILLSEGKLKVHVAQTLPLEQAAKAHAMIETGAMQGKLVLSITG